jgi:glycolate oxidase
MGHPYQQPGKADFDFFSALLGSDAVLGSETERQRYASDYTEDLSFLPDCVLLPDTAEKVAAILAYCNEHQIPVTPRGAGTGLSGGSLPVCGGLSLSTEKLNRILSIDTENFQATVEPGVINEVFRSAVEARGLFYPPDPASKGSCFLGGNIAHSSGGPKAVKYGTTRDYVLNLQVALPDGSLIWTGANTVKNSTGYNLTQLMVGSEGTLGIVTAIVFRLISLPKHNLLLLAPFANPVQACRAVNAVMLAGFNPSALELMEQSGVALSAEATKTPFPLRDDAESWLLLELDGNDPELLMQEAEQLFPLLEQEGALEVLLADTDALKEQWWKVRRSIGEVVKSASVYKEEDTVVPRFALPQLMEGVKEIAGRYGFRTVCYGHAGDGNLHVNILRDALTDAQWSEEVPKGIREIFSLCRELGGTISGEHGVGLVQKDYLDIVFSAKHFALMRGIKQVFDPKGILNPGKWV